MPGTVELLEDPKQVQAMAQPLRLRMLEELRRPDTAAGLARILGRSRQSVSYHLKELERAGLVRHAGERRKGNFMEQLYEATAKRFVVSARFTWDRERLASVLADQVSLSQLANVGERLQRDATALLDRAAFEGEDIPSATVEAEVGFADEDARTAFMGEYVDVMQMLLTKYGAAGGAPYRVVLAAYPEVEDE